MAGALEGDMFIGPNAEEHRGLLSLKYPMEHGYVNDWSDMERVWQYVYSKEQLNTFAEEVQFLFLIFHKPVYEGKHIFHEIFELLFSIQFFSLKHH